jgi:hypothetical protein
VFISWHNLEFSVPLSREDKAKVRMQKRMLGEAAVAKSNTVAGMVLSKRDKDMK